MRARLLATTACLLSSVSTFAWSATAGEASASLSYEGRSVREVLRELRRDGLLILYSSDAVGADLRVVRNPESDAPKEIARTVLAPHGLELIPGPAGRWLVVRAKRNEDASTKSMPDADALGSNRSKSEAPLTEITVNAGRYPLGRVAGAQYLSKEQIARFRIWQTTRCA